MLKILEMDERLDEISSHAGARLGALDGMQQPEELPLARRRHHSVEDATQKTNNPRRIALLIPHITQRRRHKPRVIELAHAVRGISHRRRGIEQNQKLRIRLAAVALEKALAGSSKNVP